MQKRKSKPPSCEKRRRRSWRRETPSQKRTTRIRTPAPPNWKGYLDRLPNDPWGAPYQYLNPGVYGEVDVMSYGADGAPGGEGKDADIGSWQ